MFFKLFSQISHKTHIGAEDYASTLIYRRNPFRKVK